MNDDRLVAWHNAIAACELGVIITEFIWRDEIGRPYRIRWRCGDREFHGVPAVDGVFVVELVSDGEMFALGWLDVRLPDRALRWMAGIVERSRKYVYPLDVYR